MFLPQLTVSRQTPSGPSLGGSAGGAGGTGEKGSALSLIETSVGCGLMCGEASVCLLGEISHRTTELEGVQAQHLHFTDGETEAQKGSMTCPKVNRDARPQLKPEPGSAHSRVQSSCFLPCCRLPRDTGPGPLGQILGLCPRPTECPTGELAGGLHRASTVAAQVGLLGGCHSVVFYVRGCV